MAEKMIVTYKDFAIEYSEYMEKWTCNIGDSDFSKPQLLEVKKKIDAFLKTESKFKNMLAIATGGWRDSASFRVVTITSVTDNGEIWIKDQENRREKLYSNTFLAKDNTDNKAIVEQIKDLELAKKKTDDNIKKLKESMKQIEIQQ